MRNAILFYWLYFLLIMCFLSNGCTSMGPEKVPKDQFDYATAIGEAKKQQILMNVVKLRYAEWPVFLEVGQVVAGYNWEYRGNATVNLYRMFDASKRDTAQLGVNGAYIERPTITYTPLGGERFVRSILTPARPEVMLTLIEAGWPVDRLFLTMVDSVNGKINRRLMYLTDYAADPAFIRFVQFLKKIHINNGFSIITRETEKKVVINELIFHPQFLDTQTRKELDEIKMILGLNPDINNYQIIWGSVPENPNTIAIKTRSVIHVMVALAVFVELPPEEIEKGGAVNFKMLSKNNKDIPPLINIHSGLSVPADAFVAIPYHNRWFWIDASDQNSKLSLAYLTMLLTVTETGDIKGPQLTISAN